MIKEKDLVPGKVITYIQRAWRAGAEVDSISAWMIIGFTEQVRRRHSKSSAPRDGWHVLLLRFGEEGQTLWDTMITPSAMTRDWKRWF